MILLYKTLFLVTVCHAFVHTTFTRRPTLLKAWESHVSTHPSGISALSKVLQECNTNADAAFLFVGPSHADQFKEIVQTAANVFPHLISVVGGGTIGENVELDEPSKPSLSLLTGSWPEGTKVEYFSYNELQNPVPEANDSFWKQASSYFVVADPWSQISEFTERLEDAAIVTGGLSVPSGTGSTVALGSKALPQGSLVGMRFLHGSKVGLQAVVAQGCRGVGKTMTVTDCQPNVAIELDGKPAIGQLESLIQSAKSEDEKRQISAGLVLGIATDPTEQDPKDFLIRQIAGFVPQKGGILVGGALLKKGDKLKFHVRDKDAAEEDFRLMTKRAQAARMFSGRSAKPLAALQISCVARGRNLFGTPHVDLQFTKELCSSSAVAGFYANGEFGPVGLAGFVDEGNRGTHMHGFTTVCALVCEFEEAEKESPDNAIEVPRGAENAWE